MKTLNLTKSKTTGIAGLFVVFVVLSLVPTMTEGYMITFLTDILRFAALAVAWTVFSGPTGYMSLATAAFFGIGMYIAAIYNAHLPFVVVVIAAGILGFIAAALVGALTLRLRGVYFAIFTFALVLLATVVVNELERVIVGTRGRFVATESGEVGYYAMFIVTVFTIAGAYMIRRSRYGLALQSIGEYEEAAAHGGINVVWTKIMIFAASAVPMAMAGAIIATQRAYIDPSVAFHLNISFLPVLMAMFGGMGNLAGPVIGAALFTYLGEQLLTRLPELYMLVFGVVLILSIVFMPHGVYGLGQQVWRKIRGGRRAPA